MRTLLLVCTLAIAGCGLEFQPERQGQSYPAKTKMASRLSREAPSSCEIGVIRFTGSIDDRWEDVARTAAEHGGSFYFVRTRYTNERMVTHGAAFNWGNGVTTGRATSRMEHDEQNVVVVYTCDLPADDR